MSDDSRDGGLVKFFQELGPDSKDCFRLFARGGSQPGCYVLGWWAGYVAKEYIKSSAVLKNWADNSGANAPTLDVVVVNEALCKEIIRDCLLRRGVSVEFYERTTGAGGRVSYVCVQRGSPGNIADFEASLFEFEEAEIQLMASGVLVFGPATSAENSGGVRVGFAALNTTLRTIAFAEYLDSVQLASLDALVSQTNLKELMLCPGVAAGGVVADSEERTRAVRRLCERAGVTLVEPTSTSSKAMRGRGSGGAEVASGSPKPPSAASAETETQDALRDLLRVPEERLAVVSAPLATHALSVLLRRLDALDVTNQHAYYLKHIVPSTYMKLDSAAIEALNLVSKKPEPRGALPLSVFSWLNRCHTGMGSRAMRQWLLQPLRNVDDIVQRQTMVEIFVEQPMLRDMLISHVLKRCSDMDRLNRKLQRRNIALKDTQAFLSFVAIIPEAVKVLKSYHGQSSKVLADEYVAPLEDISEHMGNLTTLVEATVDFSDSNTVRINPAFDDDLQELHDQLQHVQRDIDAAYAHTLRKYDWNEKQMKCEYHSSYGYVFRVSRKEDRQVRESKELITVSTAKDGVRFVTDRLSALSEQYKRISAEYDNRQQDLKQKLVDTIATYLPVLDDAKELLAALDVFVAWALVVKDSPRAMVKPTITDANTGEALLSLKAVRHPLVELRQPNYIANSVQLSCEVNGLIITGPNMGGKSTFMRSVGLAVVLAQAGCFVPADAAELQVRDAVMCRVGATDHLAQGVSTFMVEMLESAAILSSATPQTLAIVDELGRGTSTYDGFGLAWAIALEIAVKVRATLLFSTHFHELTQLPLQCTNLRNVHFGADVNEAEGTLRFSYKLEPGACGRSYGLHVASLAQLPEEVVNSAKEKAAELETFEDTGKASSSSVASAAAAHTASAEVAARIVVYAKRIRDLESQPPDEAQASAVKRLRGEILQDEGVRALLVATP